MAKNKQKKERKKRERLKQKEKYYKKLKQEAESVENIRAKAPLIKNTLRAQGCELRFYDLLDSYSEEFQRVAEEAKKRHSTLLDVLEVPEDIYENNDWDALGFAHLKKILFEFEDDVNDYGGKAPKANLRGCSVAFHDSNQKLHTLILVCKSVKFSSFTHPEHKYVTKIAALCHEIGHIHDMEAGINFDIENKKTNIIEAEAFAHLYALDLMAERHLYQSYNLLLNAIKDASLENNGYLNLVAHRVLEQLPEHILVDWSDFIEEEREGDQEKKSKPETEKDIINTPERILASDLRTRTHE